MSTEEPQQEAPPAAAADVDAPMQDAPTAPAPAAAGSRRPRLKLDALGMGGGERGERKRGKSMFGVLVNTLNKAKAEDKERSATEAAKKRQLIEQRLQSKLRKETDSVRQIEEAKKDKVIASRKEEDLQLKDSIHKFRRTHLPILSNFLSTSDVIPPGDADLDDDFKLSSFLPKRSHPPPLYYLPAVLLPEQEAFLAKRKAQVKEAVEKEWEQFRAERTAGVEEITTLRQKVAAVLTSRTNQENGDGDTVSSPAVDAPTAAATLTDDNTNKSENPGPKDTGMEVDDSTKENGSREPQAEGEKEKEHGAGGDEDDAVEY